MIAQLGDGAARWSAQPVAARIALAHALRSGVLGQAERLVRMSCEAKGLAFDGTSSADEWATGPWPVVRQLRLVAESLAEGARGRRVVASVFRTPNGALATRVFPGNRIDGVLFAGISAEARLHPGVTEESLRWLDATSPAPPAGGRIVLILGAGNLASIPVMDVITKLFNEGSVCLLKMNPVNAYLGPVWERALAPAIERNLLRIAYGGAEEGAYLAHHPGVAEVHLTGSLHTYEHLVWGPPGPERDTRKTLGRPLLDKPVTAELGSISPTLVVPGPYSAGELAFQTSSIAGAMVTNAGFNCCTPRVLVTPRGWADRGALLAGLRAALERAPTRPAYYPGAETQWRRLISGRAAVDTIGRVRAGVLPWTILPGVEAAAPRETAFEQESFCPVLAETEVGSADPVEFLERAVDFVNNRLWGTLSADLVVHPKLLRDPVLGAAVERAIDRLRYGVVAVNAWSGFAFTYASPPWGAFPGSTPQDIQSGTGWVHNTANLPGVEKVVLRHPLTVNPKPATFPGHRTAHRVMRRMTWLDSEAKWRRVPGVIAAAVRG